MSYDPEICNSHALTSHLPDIDQFTAPVWEETVMLPTTPDDELIVTVMPDKIAEQTFPSPVQSYGCPIELYSRQFIKGAAGRVHVMPAPV